MDMHIPHDHEIATAIRDHFGIDYHSTIHAIVSDLCASRINPDQAAKFLYDHLEGRNSRAAFRIIGEKLYMRDWDSWHPKLVDACEKIAHSVLAPCVRGDEGCGETPCRCDYDSAFEARLDDMGGLPIVLSE